jgi:hypothetical protein
MSRTKAHWRRLAAWFEGFRKMGEGWHYLQTWENPPATIATMVAMIMLCCYPHIMVCLGATILVIYMVSCLPLLPAGFCTWASFKTLPHRQDRQPEN